MNIIAMQQVALAIAGNDSVGTVLTDIVSGIADCPDVALCRIWLIREEADDREERRFLQLAASAGNLRLPGSNPTKLDGRFARFEIGEKKVGGVAASGEGVMVELTAVPDLVCFADPDWLAKEEIIAFAAQPLLARGEVVGVLAIFDREPIGPDRFAWLRTFADHAAVAITTARAFEEIEHLRQRLQQENDYLRTEVTASFGPIIGASPALNKMKRQIEMVAPTDASVLILGESGVGKELVARAIHERSERASRPLIKVNCGSIPGELFESEFFGHVRGSFTGASRDRSGRFELADGGTLFLDEIGEIPIAHQAKLLRVLQEGTFERVGEEQTRRVDVRMIAATNRDLSQATAEGTFRADLYYRLSVFPIEVPPLRDRDDDVIELAQQFISQVARKLKFPPPRLTAHHADQLRAYDWPGNVRELQHVIERGVILSRGGPLRFESLTPIRPEKTVDHVAPSDGTLPTLAELRDWERRVVAAAIAESEGKISGPGGAAERLGLKPTTLDSKLKALGLKPAGKRRRPPHLNAQ